MVRFMLCKTCNVHKFITHFFPSVPTIRSVLSPGTLRQTLTDKTLTRQTCLGQKLWLPSNKNIPFSLCTLLATQHLRAADTEEKFHGMLHSLYIIKIKNSYNSQLQNTAPMLLRVLSLQIQKPFGFTIIIGRHRHLNTYINILFLRRVIRTRQTRLPCSPSLLVNWALLLGSHYIPQK